MARIACDSHSWARRTTNDVVHFVLDEMVELVGESDCFICSAGARYPRLNIHPITVQELIEVLLEMRESHVYARG